MASIPRQNILYKNVYHALCTRIFSNEFDYGTHLPSMTELAEQYYVSIITIRATFKLLQDIGLIRVSRGKEAIVVYDIEKPESRQKFLQWLASRLYTLSEIFFLNARIASSFIKYGAALCGPSDLAMIDDISRRASSPQIPINQVALGLMDLYFILVSTTKNNLLIDLVRSCDEYFSISMILVSIDSEFCEQVDKSKREFIVKLCENIEERRFDQIEKQIHSYVLETENMLHQYISKLTAGCEHPKEIMLKWTVSGTVNLYSEIAHDLILRISTGEFLDGEHLLSEAKLQQQYKTSSKTIRNALIALSEWGIVKTTNGVGTTVTYLSPSVPPEKHFPDPSEMNLFFCSLQAVMLNAPSMLQDAFLELSEQDIEITESRVERLLATSGKCFYSYVGILLNVAVQNCKNELTKRIFQQFHTHIFLLSHKRKYHNEIFTAHLNISMPYILGALKSLRERDADGYIANVKEILSFVAKSTMLACEKGKLLVDIEMPY